MFDNISNNPSVSNISKDIILLLAAFIWVIECWIQCRSGNWTILLLLRWMRFSFLYPSKKSLLTLDILLSDKYNLTRERFTHSSGGNVSLFEYKLSVDMLWRLQNAPVSIYSKPIAESPRSCKIRKNLREIVLCHILVSSYTSYCTPTGMGTLYLPYTSKKLSQLILHFASQHLVINITVYVLYFFWRNEIWMFI